eukprot:c25122_g1_i1 orf=428-1615(+)
MIEEMSVHVHPCCFAYPSEHILEKDMCTHEMSVHVLDGIDARSCTHLPNTTTAEVAHNYEPRRNQYFYVWPFPGDNIYGADCNNTAASQVAAFAPAVNAKIPWAAVLGNHDQEGTLDRLQLMQHIVSMDYALAQINPTSINLSMSSEGHHLAQINPSSIHLSVSSEGHHHECGLLAHIEGYGNYNLEVAGAQGSSLANKSVLNLYFLDSGDYSTVPGVSGYGWIKPTQQAWFSQTSAKLKAEYMSEPASQNDSAPGLVYFHIPLPEFSSFDASNMTGVKQEGISSASVNSGFFTTMVEAGDVKAAFVGHDHVNDFCGELSGVSLCYGGGFGYHAYGLAGWSRRARVVMASLGKDSSGEWTDVRDISTWKRLDDDVLSTSDEQVLWSPSLTTSGTR